MRKLLVGIKKNSFKFEIFFGCSFQLWNNMLFNVLCCLFCRLELLENRARIELYFFYHCLHITCVITCELNLLGKSSNVVNELLLRHELFKARTCCLQAMLLWSRTYLCRLHYCINNFFDLAGA